MLLCIQPSSCIAFSPETKLRTTVATFSQKFFALRQGPAEALPQQRPASSHGWEHIDRSGGAQLWIVEDAPKKFLAVPERFSLHRYNDVYSSNGIEEVSSAAAMLNTQIPRLPVGMTVHQWQKWCNVPSVANPPSKHDQLAMFEESWLAATIGVPDQGASASPARQRATLPRDGNGRSSEGMDIERGTTDSCGRQPESASGCSDGGSTRLRRVWMRTPGRAIANDGQLIAYPLEETCTPSPTERSPTDSSKSSIAGYNGSPERLPKKPSTTFSWETVDLERTDMECMRYGVQSAWATAVPKEFNDEDALLAQRRRTKAAHTRDNAAVHSVRHSPGGIAESKHARSSGGTKNNCSSNGSTRGKIVGGTSIKKKLSFVRAPRSSKSKNSNERPTKAKYGRATSSSKHKGASRDVDVATNAAGSTPKHVHANATTSMSLKTVKARVDTGRRFKTRIFLTRL